MVALTVTRLRGYHITVLVTMCRHCHGHRRIAINATATIGALFYARGIVVVIVMDGVIGVCPRCLCPYTE